MLFNEVLSAKEFTVLTETRRPSWLTNIR